VKDARVIKVGGDYAAHRRGAYPPIEEFLDAYYHREVGNPEPMKAWVAKIAAVKASIRKPGAK
jgi:hypothetical protein